MTMDNYDDRDAYNGDLEHDMYVDYDYQTNTGEAVFDGIDDEIYFDDDYSDEEDEDYWK